MVAITHHRCQAVVSLRRLPGGVLAAAGLFFWSAVASGQPNLPVYTDHLVNGFQDWGWGTKNVTNTSPVHSGTNSFSHSGGAWNALSFEHPDFNATLYT